jgi:hypothetical protein
MARKNGRAPNAALFQRGFVFQVRGGFKAKDESHATQVATELAGLLVMAGYTAVECRLLDMDSENVIAEFAVEEAHGQETET